MINVAQHRIFVVRPVLEHIGLWSYNAEQLLICTGLQESHYEYVDQLDRGERKWGWALGFYQMEKATHDDHWRWLEGRPELRDKVLTVVGTWPKDRWRSLAGNESYAVAMARIHYRTKPGALPSGDDRDAMWLYYKRYYNSHLGAATKEQFMSSTKDHWRKGL